MPCRVSQSGTQTLPTSAMASSSSGPSRVPVREPVAAMFDPRTLE